MDRDKRQRVSNEENNEDLDRISKLSNTLLVRILSHLSTKEAVGTTLLSKRWMNLWIDLPSLDFEWDIDLSMETDMWDYDSKKVAFRKFVDRVLLLHRASCLTSCRFAHLSEFDLDVSTAWFRAFSTRQISKIVLEHCNIDLVGPFPRKSPFKLFMIESLSSLDLSRVYINYKPKRVQFQLPNLKTLNLYKVTCFNKDFFKTFIDGCHALEELCIYCCDFNKIEINSLTLSTFSLCNYGTTESLILEAPNLKTLSFCSESLCIAEVFKGVSKSDNLHSVYHDEEPSRRECESMPWFQNLTSLELKAHSQFKIAYIFCMLHHCPNLQKLVLDFDMFGRRDWMLPESVPQCLSPTLKVFEIRACNLHKNDVDVLQYILKNGLVLEEMKLMHMKMNPEKNREVLEELLIPCRASSACNIKFTRSWMF